MMITKERQVNIISRMQKEMRVSTVSTVDYNWSKTTILESRINAFKAMCCMEYSF